MKSNLKFFIIMLTVLVNQSVSSQSLMCWKIENVKYDSTSTDYIPFSYKPFSEKLTNSEVFLDKFRISIKQEKINFTKLREVSKVGMSNGITTAFEVLDSDNFGVHLFVTEDSKGNLRILILKKLYDDYGTVYYVTKRNNH